MIKPFQSFRYVFFARKIYSNQNCLHFKRWTRTYRSWWRRIPLCHTTTAWWSASCNSFLFTLTSEFYQRNSFSCWLSKHCCQHHFYVSLVKILWMAEIQLFHCTIDFVMQYNSNVMWMYVLWKTIKPTNLFIFPVSVKDWIKIIFTSTDCFAPRYINIDDAWLLTSILTFHDILQSQSYDSKGPLLYFDLLEYLSVN